MAVEINIPNNFFYSDQDRDTFETVIDIEGRPTMEAAIEPETPRSVDLDVEPSMPVSDLHCTTPFVIEPGTPASFEDRAIVENEDHAIAEDEDQRWHDEAYIAQEFLEEESPAQIGNDSSHSGFGPPILICSTSSDISFQQTIPEDLPVSYENQNANILLGDQDSVFGETESVSTPGSNLNAHCRTPLETPRMTSCDQRTSGDVAREGTAVSVATEALFADVDFDNMEARRRYPLGRYDIMADVAVTASMDPLSDDIGRLQVGQTVNVFDVAYVSTTNMARGRIEFPAGWIDLVSVDKVANKKPYLIAGPEGLCPRCVAGKYCPSCKSRPRELIFSDEEDETCQRPSRAQLHSNMGVRDKLRLLETFDMTFRHDGELTTVVFRRKPLGLKWRMKAPIKIVDVAKESHAEELGIQKTWEITAVAGVDVARMKYSHITKMMRVCLDCLPWGHDPLEYSTIGFSHWFSQTARA